jgi:hypothetical protein
MRAALDTNLLLYAEGFGDDARVSRTRQLLDQLSEADLVIPLQCLRGAGVHPGFSWRGVRVVNPLMEPLDSLLLQLLA